MVLIKEIKVPYHAGAQTVENVGRQTWRASLLLAEYVHTNIDAFRGRNILELGAGAGVPSLIAGTAAASVTMTDVSSILSLTRQSVDLNGDMGQFFNHD